MSGFLLPDRVRSREELKRDVLYRRIPEEDRIRICDMAWDRGAAIAGEMTTRYPGRRIREIAGPEGANIEVREADQVNGVFQTFGEYLADQRKIVLYAGSIAKLAEENGVSKEAAEELVAAHEFFHFLECTRIGMLSSLYTVPALRIGKLVLFRSGVRALSEIGAHGFSRTCFDAYGCADVRLSETQSKKEG